MRWIKFNIWLYDCSLKRVLDWVYPWINLIQDQEIVKRNVPKILLWFLLTPILPFKRVVFVIVGRQCNEIFVPIELLLDLIRLWLDPSILIEMKSILFNAQNWALPTWKLFSFTLSAFIITRILFSIRFASLSSRHYLEDSLYWHWVFPRWTGTHNIVTVFNNAVVIT